MNQVECDQECQCLGFSPCIVNLCIYSYVDITHTNTCKTSTITRYFRGRRGF